MPKSVHAVHQSVENEFTSSLRKYRVWWSKVLKAFWRIFVNIHNPSVRLLHCFLVAWCVEYFPLYEPQHINLRRHNRIDDVTPTRKSCQIKHTRIVSPSSKQCILRTITANKLSGCFNIDHFLRYWAEKSRYQFMTSFVVTMTSHRYVNHVKSSKAYI